MATKTHTNQNLINIRQTKMGLDKENLKSCSECWKTVLGVIGMFVGVVAAIFVECGFILVNPPQVSGTVILGITLLCVLSGGSTFLIGYCWFSYYRQKSEKQIALDARFPLLAKICFAVSVFCLSARALLLLCAADIPLWVGTDTFDDWLTTTVWLFCFFMLPALLLSGGYALFLYFTDYREEARLLTPDSV